MEHLEETIQNKGAEESMVTEEITPTEASPAVDVPTIMPEVTYCQHCGVDTKLPKFVVTEDDKLEWTRYILSGGKRRFRKSYSLFGGRVRFTLRTRTLVEEKDVDLGIAKAVTDLYSIADFSKVSLEILKLQLVFSLDSVETVDTEDIRQTSKVNFPLYTTSELHEAWKIGSSVSFEKLDSILEQSTTPVLTLILDKLAEFNTLCGALTMQGLSENF